MSHLDAGVCPCMEREVETAGALTPDDIREVVKLAFKKTRPGMCKKISRKARKNTHAAIQRKGGISTRIFSNHFSYACIEHGVHHIDVISVRYHGLAMKLRPTHN